MDTKLYRNAFQAKTLVRLVLVVVVSCVVATLLAGPRADAASDGYGVTAADAWHHPSLIEGRAQGLGAVALSALD